MKHTSLILQHFLTFLLIYADLIHCGLAQSCEREVIKSDTCIKIESFDDFKQIVENESGTFVFCPFSIYKDSSEVAYITSDLDVICKESRQCRINGPTRHIQILEESSQVFFQGFVFSGATTTAVHIISSSPNIHIFCNCNFTENKGSSRGVAILAERNTKVEVSNCTFQNNQSTDLGGSIFNRGNMKVSYSTFKNNVGRGGAIANGPRAPLALEKNIIVQNKGGVPIYFHDKSYTDLEDNMASDNYLCNGIWIDGANSCIRFQLPRNQSNFTIETPTIDIPTSPQSDTTAPKGGIGYFNYDLDDFVFGPNSGWGKVKQNPEQMRYEELVGTLRRSLINKCEWKNINQSPIDLCENRINKDCEEYHQTRTHSGNINLGDKQVTAQILPSKLRLKYYPDRPPVNGPYPPEADFANNWNGFSEVNHVDIKIPSEHTICGIRYPAEYSIYMLHPIRRQTIVMSILLTLHDDDKENEHLQKAINAWQKVYNENEVACNNRNSRFLADRNITIPFPKRFDFNSGMKDNRELRDETPFGTGGWDPFHPSLERTIYFWGYWGTLTEPPCSNFVSWRVLTEPAYISKPQLEQMKTILFTNRNEDCVYTSVHSRQSVARPIQSNRGRLLHKCTINDYVSDKEKKAMREKTGNPNWCC